MLNALLLSIADGGGGAARASFRLHQGLINEKVNSNLLVQTKLTDSLTSISPQNKIAKGLAQIRPFMNALPLKVLTQADSKSYSLQWLPDRVSSQVNTLNPEIVNIHWICDGFLRIESLAAFHRPLVWTLHDMWPFTGGCHYGATCDRYQEQCGCCPQLMSQRQFDFSSWVWKRKKRTFEALDITLVSPSRWLAKCAQSSSLFNERRVEVIPNGLDLQVYKPIDSKVARYVLNLPQDKRLIFFGAVRATDDRRKGFHLLQCSLQCLSQWFAEQDVEIVIFGSSLPNKPPNLGCRTHYLGTLKDDCSMALCYSAADIFVAPSLQDNLPNTVLEAIACGTPCVAFDIGGMPDLIDHLSNGYLARPFDIEDFAQGIKWVLTDHERLQKLSKASRLKAEASFSLKLQASRYRDLFQAILYGS